MFRQTRMSGENIPFYFQLTKLSIHPASFLNYCTPAEAFYISTAEHNIFSPMPQLKGKHPKVLLSTGEKVSIFAVRNKNPGMTVHEFPHQK